MDNPYIYDHPVDVQELFVGRRDVVEEMARKVRRSESFALLGGTRAGKTTVMVQLRQRLEGDEEGTTNRRVVGPVFLSTQQFDQLTAAGVFATIVRELSEYRPAAQRTELLQRAEELRQFGGRERGFETFCEVLATVLPSDPDFRMIIMLDEVDELRQRDWARTFFNNLRFLVSQSELHKQVSVIVAGTLNSRELWATAGSPFYNVATQKEITLLPDEPLMELVGVGFPEGLPAQVGELLLEAAGGSLYLMQFLLGRLWDARHLHDRDIDKDELQRACMDYLVERRGDFQRWWAACDGDAHTLYKHLALADGPQGRAVINRLFDMDPDRAEEAIDQLRFNGLIRTVRRGLSRRYEVPNSLFRMWLEERGCLAADDERAERPTGAARSCSRTSVFLSYAHEDKVAAGRLHDALKQRGLEVWWDERALLGGANITHAIRDGVRDADHFVLCCSENLARRERTGVRPEIALAIKKHAERMGAKGFIIPVRLDTSAVPDIPLDDAGLTGLSDLLAIDLHTGWAEGFERLVRALGG